MSRYFLGTTDWMWLALGSAVFAGLTALLSKVGVEHASPAWATLIRTGVVLLFIALMVGARPEWGGAREVSGTGLVFLVLSGLTTGLSWLCYFYALKKGPVSLVASLDKLSLPIAVFLAVLFLKERLGAWQWLGMGLMVSGALLLSLASSG